MKSKRQFSNGRKVDVYKTEILAPTTAPNLRRNQFKPSAQSTLLLLSPAILQNGLVRILQFHLTPLLCCFLLYRSIALPCFEQLRLVNLSRLRLARF